MRKKILNVSLWYPLSYQMKKKEVLYKGNDVLSDDVLSNTQCVAFISSLLILVSKGNGSPYTFTL